MVNQLPEILARLWPVGPANLGHMDSTGVDQAEAAERTHYWLPPPDSPCAQLVNNKNTANQTATATQGSLAMTRMNYLAIDLQATKGPPADGPAPPTGLHEASAWQTGC